MQQSKQLPPKWLLIALLALPQVAETILAPALPDLATRWRLDAGHTQWVMGVFFFGFALGVAFWGIGCDRWGRRRAMLTGLALALLGSLLAIAAPSYEILLGGRFLQAFGLATCSVTTQTMLRDCLQGKALTGYFVTLGMVLAWSPAIGPLAGQLAVDWQGYQAVLWVISATLLLLLTLGMQYLRETGSDATKPVPVISIARRMMADRSLQRAAILVAGLNTLVFSFYAAGPFMVGQLPALGFGWVGLAVALAGSLGAAGNRWLPPAMTPQLRICYGLLITGSGVAGQFLLVLLNDSPGIWWALAALPVFIGYGLSIPNILGPALRNYGNCIGAAGALFGLGYYAMLGAALAATTLLSFETPIPLSLFWLAITAILLLARERSLESVAAESTGNL